MKKKIIAVALACGLLMGSAVGGTVAWLISTSSTVTNTFTIGDISISIKEDVAEGALAKTFTVVPGQTVEKDPAVIVTKGSEPCYLFVKVTPKNNTVEGLDGDIISWEVKESDSDWIDVPGYIGKFWYREVDASKATNDMTFYILNKKGTYVNGGVTVNSDLTKELKAKMSGSPELVFQAAAIQKSETGTVTEAFAKLPSSFTGITTP